MYTIASKLVPYSNRVATHQKLKNSLARWIIKNTENHWSKLLFLQMSLKSIIFHDALLTEKYNSLTFHWLLQTSKIFPDLLQNYFSLTFPWPWQACSKLFFPVRLYRSRMSSLVSHELKTLHTGGWTTQMWSTRILQDLLMTTSRDQYLRCCMVMFITLLRAVFNWLC